MVRRAHCEWVLGFGRMPRGVKCEDSADMTHEKLIGIFTLTVTSYDVTVVIFTGHIRGNEAILNVSMLHILCNITPLK
jgi:hypothetical protein